MKLLGLTGGIGMGKSTAARFLAQMGATVLDTDAIAREVVEPGQPALEEIRNAFGPSVIDPSGCLNRAKLARVVFTNAPARERLEAILHPRIRQIWLHQVQDLRKSGAQLVIVVIPLLFETGAASAFDATICVACSARTQWSRLRARAWADDEIRQRIQAQWPIEKKMLAANFVTWAEGSLSIHADQLRRILSPS